MFVNHSAALCSGAGALSCCLVDLMTVRLSGMCIFKSSLYGTSLVVWP